MNDVRAQEEIDALIARLFSAFDNRAGATPTLARLTDCFNDKAVIARRSDAGADLYTAAEFALPRIAVLTDGTLVDFHEVELSATTHCVDGIATRTSRHGKSGVLTGAHHRGPASAATCMFPPAAMPCTGCKAHRSRHRGKTRPGCPRAGPR